MAITFDEAFEEIEELSFTTDEGDSWVNNHSSVYALIQELQDAYVPTIEMTEMQMKQMMSFKEVNAGFSTFMYKQGLGQVPAFSDFITTERENELIQAWLHPETIKVVD